MLSSVKNGSLPTSSPSPDTTPPSSPIPYTGAIAPLLAPVTYTTTLSETTSGGERSVRPLHRLITSKLTPSSRQSQGWRRKVQAKRPRTHATRLRHFILSRSRRARTAPAHRNRPRLGREQHRRRQRDGHVRGRARSRPAPSHSPDPYVSHSPCFHSIYIAPCEPVPVFSIHFEAREPSPGGTVPVVGGPYSSPDLRLHQHRHHPPTSAEFRGRTDSPSRKDYGAVRPSAGAQHRAPPPPPPHAARPPLGVNTHDAHAHDNNGSGKRKSMDEPSPSRSYSAPRKTSRTSADIPLIPTNEKFSVYVRKVRVPVPVFPSSSFPTL